LARAPSKHVDIMWSEGGLFRTHYFLITDAYDLMY
jgi:hypothetical protein